MVEYAYDALVMKSMINKYHAVKDPAGDLIIDTIEPVVRELLATLHDYNPLEVEAWMILAVTSVCSEARLMHGFNLRTAERKALTNAPKMVE